MQPLIRSLDRVRRRTRALLLIMRGSMWLTAAVAAMLLAGLADYVLRFPGWLRLAIVLIGAAVAVYYCIRLVGRAARVNPSLPSLALRLEQLYPAAAGRLASAVAFETRGGVSDESAVTAELVRHTARDAQGVLGDEQVQKLIDVRPVLRAVAGLLVVLGVLTGVALGAPKSFEIAVDRWTEPFGEARWPNRYRVESLTDRTVAANNAPIPFSARVVKGDRADLRTWVVYRFTRDGSAAGPWHRTLMTRQNEQGVYERPVEPQPGADGVEFYFQAGDDSTMRRSMRLIQPPTLTALVAELDPPPYAAGLLTADRHDLLQPPRPAVTVEVLEGSRIHLQFSVEGSFTALPPEASPQELRDWLGATLVGLLDDVDADVFAQMKPTYQLTAPSAAASGERRGPAAAFEVEFNLLKPVRFRLSFADAYGSRYDDQRLFVFEVRPDRTPRVAVTVPRGDESVLPTAALPVAAEAHDDVAVERLDLQARPKDREPLDLAGKDAAEARAQVTGTVDLAPLQLKAGDEVALVAVARDNFQLADRVHDPVESPPRTLRIISEQDLSRQIHEGLADLRQRALRAEASQRQLLEAPATTSTVQQQQDLTQRLAQMEQSIRGIQDRVEVNRLEDERLSQTLDESQALLDDAGEASQRAAGQLSAAAADPQQAPQATQDARSEQGQAARKLQELTELLDEGRDAYELRQKLVKLAREQEALSEAARQTLPKTLGRELDQLSPEQQRELAEQGRKQSQLSQEARELTERMRTTAAAVSRRSEDADQQAMAEALRQASQTATSENLDQKMQQASEQIEQNQVADARQSQDQAQQTLRQMLEQINRAEQLKQQILRRKLAELIESIRRLRDQQSAQLERLMAAQNHEGLDGAMLTLRRNTLSVAESARATDPQAAPVADHLETAGNHQGDAVRELRAMPVDAAAAEAGERASLAALEKALALAQELSSKAQQQLTEDERRKLIEQYTKALEQQKAVHGQTQDLTAAPQNERNRRWRADSLKAGKQQEEVGALLNELRDKIGQTIVYRSVHDQVEQWIEQSSADLSAARPTATTEFRQDMIITSIESLIESLEQEQPDEEQFAEGENAGGGGGGQQGGPQPLIPPAAELKLLKARQLTLINVTRSLEQAPAPDVRQAILQEAAAQQKSLAENGEQLLEKLQQQMQAPSPAPQD